jgi:GTP 3',8-cyclase
MEFVSSSDPLVDRFARRVRYLRVSITDRCNYECSYCVPEQGVTHGTRADVLTFEEIERIVGVFAGLGVRRVRLTGGEPTVRQGVVALVARLRLVAGIDELVMTSNGHRLPELAEPLAAAGLTGVNVSLDTLDPNRFTALTARGDLSRVIAGIDAARAVGLDVKLNAVMLAGVNDGELAELVGFAWERGLTLRFIEHMPLSSGALFQPRQAVSAATIRSAVTARYGQLQTSPRERNHAGPARYWCLVDRPDREFGIISAMTEHFCDACNRVRITADGQLHACLGHDDAVSLRDIVRSGGDAKSIDAALRRAIAWSMAGKRAGHEFQSSGAGGPRKHMISMGG